MIPFRQFTGLVAPLDRANVDTDQIIPKQFLKRVERSGFGEFLFFDWRYTDDGAPRPDFVLNFPRYRGAAILLARDNFGCGSSREHAPWALADYGFRVIIAPSFADIFRNNCFKNGMLPVRLDAASLEELFQKTAGTEGYRLAVDLETKRLSDTAGWTRTFDVQDFQRHCLLDGLDDIGITLRQEEAIRVFEERRGM